MANNADVWQPRELLELSGDTKQVEERQVAISGQFFFTLTTFAYAINTGALEIYKNGLHLSKGTDWVENTSTTFSLVSPCTTGDVIIAVGKVGITANVDVRDTDIFIANVQNLRDYAGTEVTVYVQGTTAIADGGEGMFNKKTGAAPGTYVDDAGVTTIVPTGGNGSSGWKRNALDSRLAASPGSSLIGFIQAGTGAVARTAQTKARERVSVADFLSNPSSPSATDCTTALQLALNSGAKRVYLTGDYTINGGVTLAANQVLDFDGGSLIIQAGTVAANGILYGSSKYGITIKDPNIDASATAGIGGINLVDCPSGKVVRGTLTKCNLNFQSNSASTRMGYSCRDTFVNMAGWVTATACYVSKSKNVRLSGVETANGKEGFGIYNGATNVRHTDCDSYGHTQDGFVVIAGSLISYTGCSAYSNAQSGFTTQRQAAATDTVKISYANCQAYSNSFDGFDLRGKTASAAFGVDIFITATSCQSYSNAGTGFYVVLAEGTTLTGCVASVNLGQGFFIQESARTILTGCRSNSNASTVGAGTSKAGILVQDAAYVQLNGCVSTNAAGATQSYGLSFTGAASTNGSVSGGNYENNSTAPIYLGASGTATYVTGAAIQTTGNVWCDTITANTGAYSETGFGVPAHTRPKGSIFRRTDGAGGEIYMTNGGGVWTGITIP